MTNFEKIADVTLALMHLGILEQDGVRARKMYPPEALRILKRRGYIADPSARTKTTPITKEGLERARQLYLEYFGDGADLAVSRHAEATYAGPYPNPERGYEAIGDQELQRVEMRWSDATMPLDTGSQHDFEWYFDTVDHQMLMIDRGYFLTDPDPDDIHPSDRKVYEQQRAIDADEERRYRLFPPVLPSDEWRRMEKFTRGIEPVEVAREFEHAIHGKGAFRYFRDRVHEYELQDEWRDYEALSNLQRLHEWFASQGFRLVLTDMPDWLLEAARARVVAG